jgi:hypothetical protein
VRLGELPPDHQWVTRAAEEVQRVEAIVEAAAGTENEQAARWFAAWCRDELRTLQWTIREKANGR